MADTSTSTVTRVLVVDDAPVNIKLLKVILSGAGFGVLEATSGVMALEVLRRERPDAMLLDVSMPGMTGYDVCEAVRRDPLFGALPVLMVTGLSLPEERERGFSAGATEFITKPFDRRELLARLRASLVSTVAEGEESALCHHLPGAVLLTDPAWKILGISPHAAALLALPRPPVGVFAFDELLDPKNLAAAQSGGEFQFQMNGRAVIGLQQMVNEPGGAALMRMISLRTANDLEGA